MIDIETCPICGSKDTVWRGYRYNKSGKKRLRKCNDCGRKYTPDDGFLRMRKPKESIVEAVSLYIDGLPLSKVKKHLWQHHGVKASRWAILTWVRKYSKMLQEYVKDFKPEIKGNIHADEVVLKVKGKKNWDWGAIDKETKYKYSGPLTKKRDSKGAIELFKGIKEHAANEPEKIITDKLAQYKIAYNKIFYKNRKPLPKLVHGVPIACKKYGLKHNNNAIERDNGRIKQRYKIMKGFKERGSGEDTVKLMDIFHNFIDPHMGLDGETPAKRAGINKDFGRNILLGLIFFCTLFHTWV